MSSIDSYHAIWVSTLLMEHMVIWSEWRWLRQSFYYGPKRNTRQNIIFDFYYARRIIAHLVKSEEIRKLTASAIFDQEKSVTITLHNYA